MLRQVKVESVDEWKVLWEALAQYVENSDPEEIGFGTTEEQKKNHEIAQILLNRFDAEMIRATVG